MKRRFFLCGVAARAVVRTTLKQRARNRSSGFLVEVPQLPKKEAHVSILWIVLIVVLVLALLGFVGRAF